MNVPENVIVLARRSVIECAQCHERFPTESAWRRHERQCRARDWVCGVRDADRAIQPTVFAMQGEHMSILAPLKPLPGDELTERIRQLASQGLKLRDISSLLGVHPEIVRRVLEAKNA